MWRELPAETRDWSEEDWEEFFKRQDERYFAEVQAQSLEQPAEADGTLSPCGADQASSDADDEDLIAEDPEYEVELDEELSRIPVLRAAIEFCDRTMEFVSPICNETRGGPMEYVTRTLCTECYLVPDYVLAGHEIGYDEDTLCGNIALCVRSRRSINRCIQCLERLGGPSNEACRKLIVRAIVTRVLLDQRIAELRKKVWWR